MNSLTGCTIKEFCTGYSDPSTVSLYGMASHARGASKTLARPLSLRCLAQPIPAKGELARAGVAGFRDSNGPAA